MSEIDRPDISQLAGHSASISIADPRSPFPPAPAAPRIRPRLKKLRLALVLIVLGLLALVSAVFGMIMAVASDLPALENAAEFKVARNSVLLDDQGRRIGILTGDQNRVLVGSSDIPPVMKRAMIAIEDKRFYTESGIDFRGMARALVADVTHGKAVQGASTIAQQFVKNQLAAQNHRTIFEKLREAALAFHLTRKWSKDKILTEYLNTIYFGNGAYGIEAAARTYFGNDPNHAGCGTPTRLCVTELKPWEAALLAGMVASPSGYDPVSEPQSALARRNLVLADMYQQGYLTRDEYQTSVQQVLPLKTQIKPPQVKALDPSVAYFTTWVQQQVVQRFGATQAFDGGLKVRTTLDLDLQARAQQAINNYLAYTGGPTASLVAIDNATGAVRAMVGGRNYYNTPFNLATQGQRQPGSAFKAFVLAQALSEGISPNSVWPSEVRSFIVPGTHGREHFVVHNDNNAYAGSRSLTDATTYSDNSVFAAVGIQVAGVSKIARLAMRMGIRTPVSHNLAITIGGLHQGVTVLDMAHAYETLAHGGQLVTGSLGAGNNGPVGIQSVQFPGRSQTESNATKLVRVLSPNIASTETSMLENVITQGTGKAAAIGGFEAGKTGTTENYGDAWFVGFTKKLTVAVWVGYPDSTKPMKYDFNGSPVLGGTYPAEIWHDFMTSAQQLYADRAATVAAKAGNKTGTSTTTTGSGTSSTQAPAQPGGSTAPSGANSRGSGGSAPSTQGTNQTTPAPATGGGGNGNAGGNGTAGGGGGGSPPPAPTQQQSTPSPGASGGSSAPSGAASPSG